MGRRATIADLADAAGVSVATVDRVLNGRAPVRGTTAQRVFEAAQEIGFHGANLIGQRIQVDLPEFKLGVVLHREKQAFFQGFRDAAERAAQRVKGYRAKAVVRFSQTQSPGDYAAAMDALADEVDAIAAIAVAHVETADAVARLQAQGVPCISLLNDFAQGERRGYVGLNNMKVGRIAGHMMAVAIREPGKIGVFVGGYRWHGHELRETGFRSYLREYARDLQVLDALINLETRQVTYEATLDLLDRHPDLRGIYCAGGGMEGAIAALRELRTPGEVKLIVHELTPESRLALADRYVDMVLSTPLDALCDEVFAQALTAKADGVGHVHEQLFLQPEIYLPESV